MILTNKKHKELYDWFKERAAYFDEQNEPKCRMICDERWVLGFFENGECLVIGMGKNEFEDDYIKDKIAFEATKYNVEDVKKYIWDKESSF